jgi:hypothetical protein
MAFGQWVGAAHGCTVGAFGVPSHAIAVEARSAGIEAVGVDHCALHANGRIAPAANACVVHCNHAATPAASIDLPPVALVALPVSAIPLRALAAVALAKRGEGVMLSHAPPRDLQFCRILI